jgi:hypothetical protein
MSPLKTFLGLKKAIYFNVFPAGGATKKAYYPDA